MTTYRDRTRGYIPDDLSQHGGPGLAEVGQHRDPETGRTSVLIAPVRLGLADELNRRKTWWWADVSGDGTHWSHFTGHHIQIDVTFATANEREVNGWKGRDEIRATGTWTLALQRQPCWEGGVGTDPLLTLAEIPRITRQLIEHSAIDWTTGRPAAEQLQGRRVYYDRTPAVISSTSVLPQGCIMLRPVGLGSFPPPVWAIDDDGDDDDRDEIKTSLLDPHIWWWRTELPADAQTIS